jgi:hypothetical protein
MIGRVQWSAPMPCFCVHRCEIWADPGVVSAIVKDFHAAHKRICLLPRLAGVDMFRSSISWLQISGRGGGRL